MKTKIKIAILTSFGLGVFCIIFIIYAYFFDCGCVRSDATITSYYCSSVLKGIDVIIKFGGNEKLLDDDEKDLINQKKRLDEIGDRDSLEINTCLVPIFKASANIGLFGEYIDVNALTRGGELFYDAYGSPLYFMNKTNLLFEKINHSRILGEGLGHDISPYFVWSAGKNKINEFGYGDDIMPYQ